MASLLRATVVTLFMLASAMPAMAQQKDKPLPEPMAMGIPVKHPPAVQYWYVPVMPPYTPPGTYYTVYPASRPVIVMTQHGPVARMVPTAPVVVGPTWALSPVAPGPIYGYGR